MKLLFQSGVWGLIFMLAYHGPALAQEERTDSSKSNPIRVVNGVGFSVPADWPIERRNGATGPIPIEEYMAMKFSRLEDRVSILEQKIAVRDGAEQEKVKTEKNRLQSYESSTTNQGGSIGYVAE